MEQAAKLEQRVKKARPALAGSAAARPFSLVLDNVVAAYQPLALEDPTTPEHTRENLGISRRMIHWYADREQWVQAVSLAREWLVSWLMIRLSVYSLTDQAARRKVEYVIGAEAQDYLVARKDSRHFTPVFLAEVEEIESLLSFWLAFTDVRNDIDHAGMRANPGDPQHLINRIRDGIEFLESLEV
jgi:hypothetical protein